MLWEKALASLTVEMMVAAGTALLGITCTTTTPVALSMATEAICDASRPGMAATTAWMMTASVRPDAPVDAPVDAPADAPVDAPVGAADEMD